MKNFLRAIGLTALALVALAAPATAQQTQYPPTSPPSTTTTTESGSSTTSTTAAPSSQVLGFGAQRPGQTFNKRDCGFQAGTQATIRLNDTSAGTKTAGSDGCVTLAVTIVRQDRIRIEGSEFPARRCANNSIFVTAPASAGGSRTVENQFNIDCGPAPAAAGAGTLPRTGSELARLGVSGLVLVGLGAGAVVATRRRRITT